MKEDNIVQITDDGKTDVKQLPITIVPATAKEIFKGTLADLEYSLSQKQSILDLNKSNMDRTVARIQVEIDHAQADVDVVQKLIDSVQPQIDALPARPDATVVTDPVVDPVVEEVSP